MLLSKLMLTIASLACEQYGFSGSSIARHSEFPHRLKSGHLTSSDPIATIEGRKSETQRTIHMNTDSIRKGMAIVTIYCGYGETLF
jgi:hypothetical protein